jgi:hypothetical protein
MIVAGNAAVKKTVRSTVGEAGSTQGCRVTATDLSGGQIDSRHNDY